MIVCTNLLNKCVPTWLSVFTVLMTSVTALASGYLWEHLINAVHLDEGLQLCGNKTLKVQPVGSDGASRQTLKAGVCILVSMQQVSQGS